LSTAFRLRIPRRFYDAMVAQALTEAPDECCGLLGGEIARNVGMEAVGQVMTIHPLVNAAKSPKEFLSEPRSMFEAVRALRAQALDILAIYHSHPTTEPVPSRTDLVRNYYEDVLNLIISLAGAAPVVRGWWLTAEQYREAEWEIL
jgi:proteasome lid subunit RPN8/RPN11